MIKANIKAEIEEALDDANFNKYDFLIAVEGGSEAKITITYEYDNTYYFTFTIPNRKTSFNLTNEDNQLPKSYFDFRINGIMVPGDIAFRENFESAGVDSVYSLITDWLINLWDELTSKPVERFAREQKEEIENLKQIANKFPDEYFTREEAEELKKRLEKIEKDFTNRIKKLEEDKKVAKEQIERFKEQIEVLKQTIPALKKRGWFKSFITKTMTWFSDPKNQKLMKAGKELVTSMIPENTGPAQ